MDKDYLLLKWAALSRPSGEWSDDDFMLIAQVAMPMSSFVTVRR
jgi:hypothetical protein